MYGWYDLVECYSRMFNKKVLIDSKITLLALIKRVLKRYV